MPRTKKLHPVAVTSRKANARPPVTHEAIAADIEAFRGAGGKIEVLGVTRTLLRIDTEESTPTQEK
jgi:2-C-methyl-D-erythritol 4-phosphate cytidylyltransferase